MNTISGGTQPHPSVSNSEFVAILFGARAEGAVPWVASFEADPGVAAGSDWKGCGVAMPASGAPDVDGRLPPHHNNFISIASVRGERKAAAVAGIHLLVLDDVTSDTVRKPPLSPTYVIETSPGNFHMGYRLEEPENVGLVQYAALTKALVSGAGADENGNNPARYVRLPVGSNSKAKHIQANGGKPWQQVTHVWAPERMYSMSKIAEAWGVTLPKAEPRRAAGSRKSGAMRPAATPQAIECTQAEHDRAVEALRRISSADYDDWLQVGMCLHSTGWAHALALWDWWSENHGGNYQSGACEEKWGTFSDDGGLTLGTLFHMAGMSRGHLSPGEVFGEVAATGPRADLPMAVQVALADESRTYVSRDGQVSWNGFPDKLLDEETGHIKRLKPTIENLEYLMAKYGAHTFANVYTKQPGGVLPWKQYLGKGDGEADDIVSEVMSLSERTGLPTKHLDKNLITIARRNEFNPVLEYLENLDAKVEPDGTDYIRRVCDSIRVPEHHEAARDIAVRLMLLAACAAADGAVHTPLTEAIAKYEYVTVMVGAQGAGKTTWLRSLLPEALRDYCKSGVTLDPKDKDSVMRATGSWLVELGELDATFRRTDVAKMKAFLSEEQDEYRVPYGRAVSRWKRRTVYIGTCNDSAFLSDSTGNRRYLAFRVLALPAHGVDPDQLWLQAWRTYLAGARWWPTTDEDKVLEDARAEFDSLADDPVVQRVMETFGPLTPERTVSSNLMQMKDILLAAGIFDARQSDQNRLSNYLERRHVTADGRPQHVVVNGVRKWRMPRAASQSARNDAALTPAGLPASMFEIGEDGLPAFLH